MWSVALVAAGALGAPALSAQVPSAAPAAFDSAGLVEVAAVYARQAAQRFEPRGRTARPDPGAAAYATGLDWLQKGQIDSAVASLRTAVTASPNLARYHGDLALALAATGHWSDAEDEYRAAVRLQQGNPWYFVALGAAQEAQQHWSQAAASFTLAVSVDSAVIIRQLIEPASVAFQRAGMAQPLEDWARMGTTRFPNEPGPWLEIASAYMRRDTAVGFPAIRRYRSLRPDDRIGAMLYSEYMITAGVYDSALVLARQAAADSSLHRSAAIVMYTVAGSLLHNGQFARADSVLQQGRALALESDYPHFDLFLGIAKLRELQPFYNDVVQHSDCGKSHAVDSMVTNVTRLLTAGVAADSALATQGLTGPVAQYRTAVDGFVKQCGRH